MSALSTPTGDELLRLLTGEFDTPQNKPAPSDHETASDSRSLEVLVRLIVKDELQRHPFARPSGSDSENPVESNEARGRAPTTTPSEGERDSTSDAQVMSAEDVAAFLGIDRNTVYDYAGRGTIPCRRLGKRLLFHRPVIVSWLDPCKAALTRKG
jgi:hypothetical protein